MALLIRTCELEMDFEAYAEFMLRHHGELNLPYSFAVKLGFMCSPLPLGKALLLIDEESYEPVGAAGFVYGTGPGAYDDRHICQIETAFVRPEYRMPTVFSRLASALLHEMKLGNPEADRVQFWTSAANADPSWNRLLAKLAALPQASVTPKDKTSLYAVPLAELLAYSRRLSRDRPQTTSLTKAVR